MAFKEIKVQEDISPNLIPMIDIMFLLLLFFMLNADMSSRQLEELTPPLAKHSDTDDPKATPDRITINIHHDLDDPKNPKCLPFVQGEVCRSEAHWHISLQGRKYEVTKSGMDRLAQALTEMGKARIEDPVKRHSARNLLIRADRTAPYGYVQKVLEQASVGKIYKIEVGASKRKEDAK